MRTRPERLLSLAAAVAVLSLLTGCAPGATASPDGTAATVLGMDAVLGVDYTTNDGEPVELDLYLPEGDDSPRGAVVLLHGGGFLSGDRATGGMQRIAEQIVGMGYIAASMSYSFAPAATYPTQVDEALAAVEFLRDEDNAATWDIDPDRIALLGSSAGATIALQAGVLPQDETGIGAVVSLSGASVLDASALELGNPGSNEVRSALAYLGCADVAGCAIGTDASPALRVTADSSPMLIANGVGEVIPEQQAEQMAAALEAAGVAYELDIIPKASHAAELLSDELWGKIDDFLSEHLSTDG